jgi:hypothetical protein
MIAPNQKEIEFEVDERKSTIAEEITAAKAAPGRGDREAREEQGRRMVHARERAIDAALPKAVDTSERKTLLARRRPSVRTN